MHISSFYHDLLATTGKQFVKIFFLKLTTCSHTESIANIESSNTVFLIDIISLIPENLYIYSTYIFCWSWSLRKWTHFYHHMDHSYLVITYINVRTVVFNKTLSLKSQVVVYLYILILNIACYLHVGAITNHIISSLL